MFSFALTVSAMQLYYDLLHKSKYSAGLEWPPKKFSEVMLKLLSLLGVPAFVQRHPALIDSILHHLLTYVEVRFHRQQDRPRIADWICYLGWDEAAGVC